MGSVHPVFLDRHRYLMGWRGWGFLIWKHLSGIETYKQVVKTSLDTISWYVGTGSFTV
jgi:hypothetical protein